MVMLPRGNTLLIDTQLKYHSEGGAQLYLHGEAANTQRIKTWHMDNGIPQVCSDKVPTCSSTVPAVCTGPGHAIYR